MMKIIVAGGRDFSDKEVAFKTLDTVINPGDIIVSGHARGADMLGEMYAKEYGLELELYPAEWLIELLEHRKCDVDILRDDDVLRAAKSIKSWCIAHYDRDGCEGCPFFDTKTRTKCMVSPNRDPWEWRLVRYSRRVDNEEKQ